MKIAIYGAGGLGREVAAMIEEMNRTDDAGWEIIGFFDDGIPAGQPVGNFGTVLGGMDTLNAWTEKIGVVLCMGAPATVRVVRERITNPAVCFPNIVAPDFHIADPDSFVIGEGNIICSNCRVTVAVSVGNFNLLNGSVVIGHDSRIGDYNVFMPGVRISGEVSIGNGNLFGSMSFVKQCLKIGDNITLSPLSPLLTRPKDGQLYIGNPAKIFRI